MEFELWHFFLVAAVCGLAGFVDAIAGGGGLLTVPLYLTIGLTPQETLGTNKSASTIGTIFAVFRYLKSGLFHHKLALSLVVVSFSMGLVGASFSSAQTRASMSILLLIIVPTMLLLQPTMARRAEKAMNTAAPLAVEKIWLRAVLLTAVVGFYDGFFGPGTGTLMVFGLVLFAANSYPMAVVYGRFVNFSSNLGALAFFGSQGVIVWQISAVAIFGSVFGNWLGSGMALKKSSGFIQLVFRLVLTAMLLKLVYDLIA